MLSNRTQWVAGITSRSRTSLLGPCRELWPVHCPTEVVPARARGLPEGPRRHSATGQAGWEVWREGGVPQAPLSGCRDKGQVYAMGSHPCRSWAGEGALVDTTASAGTHPICCLLAIYFLPTNNTLLEIQILIAFPFVSPEAGAGGQSEPVLGNPRKEGMAS